VSQVEIFDQLLVASGLLEGVQVLAVQVFYKCPFETRNVIRNLHYSGDCLQAGTARRTTPSFAGDQFEPVVDRPNEYRLNNTDTLDRIDKGRQRFLIEIGARLMLVRLDK
jgi:hypothetical protein